MKKFCVIFVLTILCSFSSQIYAEDLDMPFIVPPNQNFTPMEGEGAFVEYPTQFGAFAIGVPLGIAGATGGFIAETLLFPLSGKHGWGIGVGGTFLRRVGNYVGQYGIGIPFYIIKKITWDGPKKLFRWIFPKKKIKKTPNKHGKLGVLKN